MGRPREKLRLADGAPTAQTVAAVIAALPEGAGKRVTGSEEEKGPRTYDWAAVPIVESRNGLPGPEGWLLARCSLLDLTDLTYYLSNTPQETVLVTLADIASARWSIETTVEEAKGETGLDEKVLFSAPSLPSTLDTRRSDTVARNRQTSRHSRKP